MNDGVELTGDQIVDRSDISAELAADLIPVQAVTAGSRARPSQRHKARGKDGSCRNRSSRFSAEVPGPGLANRERISSSRESPRRSRAAGLGTGADAEPLAHRLAGDGSIARLSYDPLAYPLAPQPTPLSSFAPQWSLQHLVRPGSSPTTQLRLMGSPKSLRLGQHPSSSTEVTSRSRRLGGCGRCPRPRRRPGSLLRSDPATHHTRSDGLRGVKMKFLRREEDMSPTATFPSLSARPVHVLYVGKVGNA